MTELIELLNKKKMPDFGKIEILFKDGKPFDIIISERLRVNTKS